MMTATLAFLMALLIGTLFWRRLNERQKQKLHEEIADNVRTLLAILAIATLPASLLLPRLEWMAAWVVPVLGLSLWGFFLVAFWDNQVVPADALDEPTKPSRPDRAPLPTANGTPIAEGDVGKQVHWTFTPQNGHAASMPLDLTLSSERDMPEPHALHAAFAQLHHSREWSTLEQASNILSFTQQCIDYHSDEATSLEPEWPRYPIEMLMDETGDCEDDVILTAAVPKRLGFDVAVLSYPGHCALGIAGARALADDCVTHEDKGYFHGETTAWGWHLGGAPSKYQERRVKWVAFGWSCH